MRSPHARLPTWAKVVLPLALLVFAVGGLWFYRAQDQDMRRKVEEELATIAGLKAEQIVAWRRDQMEDAGLIAENATLVVATARYWANPGGETDEQLLRVFRRVQKDHDYADILLVDANGHVRLSLAGATGRGHPEMLVALEASLRDRRPILVDLHAGDLDKSPHVSVVAPVFSDATGGEPAGALVLISEARTFLYPLLQSWPRPSKTAETLLIRRDGDEVLFLNPLRHQAGTALTLRIPMTQTDIAAVMAVLGRRGVVYGRDYRGVPVVSYISAIPDSPWLMVAKEDVDEAFSDWRFRSVMILALLAGLAAASGAVILVVWQRNENSHYRTLYETESALRALSARQQALLAAVPDIIMEVDGNKVYTWANRAGLEFFGEDVVGREAAFYFEGNQDTYETVGPLFKGHEDVIYVESWQRRRDGEKRLLAWWCRVLKDAEGNVAGALSSARDITERAHAEEALQENERKFRETVAHLDEGFYSCTMDGLLLEHNLAFNRILGFDASVDLRGATLPDFWQDPAERKGYLAALTRDGLVRNRLVHAKKTKGEKIVVLASAHLVRSGDGGPARIEGTVLDITDRWQAEESLRETRDRLEEAQRVAGIGSWEWDAVKDELTGSAEFYRLFDVSLDQLCTYSQFVARLHPADRDRVQGEVADAIKQTRPYDTDYRVIIRDGTTRDIGARGRVSIDADGVPLRMVGTCLDITARKQAEQQLVIQKRIADIFLTMPDDDMFYEVLKVVLEAMESPFGVFGYLDEAGALVVPTMTRDIWDKCEVPEKSITFPRSTWGDSSWPRAVWEKRPNYSNERSTRTPSGHVVLTRHVSLPILFHGDVIGLFQVANKAVDYTKEDLYTLETIAAYVAPVLSARLARQRQEEQLRSLNQELARANTELQRFAYVASHDLQEPLRMIASYLQLIERRYKDRLDSDGLEFMAFAVDGANRLQTMIRDLLEYSRVGSRGMPFEEVDADEALDQALLNLQVQIADSGAVTTHDPLPPIMADPTQIVQVFQNLISNAIKFKGSAPPRIHVSSRRQADEWIFSVRDNGLGVAPEFNERIFIVFQRLQGREYPGTGIGLAICKRIVERHKGRIWVESEAGKGATFHFSIPIVTGGNG